MDAIVYAVAGFVCGAVAVGWRLLIVEKHNAELKAQAGMAGAAITQMETQFKVSAQEAIKGAHESFLQLARENFKQSQSEGNHDLEKRQKAISELVDPIGKTLKEMELKIETLGKAGTGLETQLRTFSDIQNRLRDETSNLVRALRNPGQGGRWGEMHLQRTLESMGMVEGTHYERQVYSNHEGEAQKPDFVLSMPSGLHIVIDVKSPMDPYLEANATDANDEMKRISLERLQKALRGHLTELSRKEYWQRFNSPDFVVMYLPSEGLFSTAVSLDPTLLEDAAAKKIIIASPTTLMGLVRVAHYGWQQKNIAEEAQKIARLGAELYNRVAVFGEHMQKLGNTLNSAVGNYNKAVGSLESKVLPGAKKFKDLHVQVGAKEIPELPPLEETARLLSAPELVSFDEDEDVPKARIA